MNRRQTIAALGAIIGAPAALAQAWPSKPIKLISAFAPGGGSDFVARYLSVKLAQGLGQPVIVENKAGAGGVLGTDFVAKSTPDGHTILIGSNGPLSLAPSLQARLSYDPLRDLQPVSLLTRHPYLLVVAPTTPVRDLRGLIELAKAQPDQLNYGTPGTGSAPHLAFEMLKLQAGIKITHVPYKAASLALTDLLGGVIQLVSTDVNTVMPLLREGKVRALAVSTARRSPLLPEVPTVAESGVAGYDVPGWFGVLVRAGTPKPIVDRLHAEIAKAMARPEAREAMGGLGGELLASTPEQFAAHIASERQRWKLLITTLNIKPDS
ncbi:tripartite tricarboxylate transporter substrate binding protein [Variovorax sp. KK3]|uniref:Bug family tripartite tricarboxylate transporter substrate binding protein n=1 Tax=Variovorax sp. KK3 TaxID=1855728 RepID=UPI00097CB7BD|nr:tripartite tricarboxylate transporter substrate binding protein [Variovorax sp. KK3]